MSLTISVSEEPDVLMQQSSFHVAKGYMSLSNNSKKNPIYSHYFLLHTQYSVFMHYIKYTCIVSHMLYFTLLGFINMACHKTSSKLDKNFEAERKYFQISTPEKCM